MGHKANSLEMDNRVNGIPEEVPSCHSKCSPSLFIPTKCKICRQGGRTEAPDGQGDYNEYVNHRHAAATPG